MTRRVHDPDGLNTGSWPAPAGQFITPTDQFFTRSHAAVPRLDAESWRLEVDGLVDHSLTLSLDQLDGFPQREVTATLICAGLRRDEFLSLGPMPGELPWGPEPAGTARWRGVALRDILAAAGVHPTARHVELEGLDRIERHGKRFGFGVSIDLEKARAPDVLLATEMNGAPLAPEHGFPLRAVVPGWVGARSVKWLGRIRLGEQPSANYFQTSAYRVQREIHGADSRDVSAGVALGPVAVNSVIVEPVPNQVLPGGLVQLRGWAIGSEGIGVTAVEVAAGDDHSWTPARLSRHSEAWSWTLWEAELKLPPGRYVLTVRARDKAGHTQPASLSETWNVKGYANNAWHRVAVNVT